MGWFSKKSAAPDTTQDSSDESESGEWYAPQVAVRKATQLVHEEMDKLVGLRNVLRFFVLVTIVALGVAHALSRFVSDDAAQNAVCAGAGIVMFFLLIKWFSILETVGRGIGVTTLAKIKFEHVPQVTKDHFFTAHKIMASLFAWITAIWLLAIVVPIWKTVPYLVASCMAIAVLAAAFMSGKLNITETPWHWYGLAVFAALVLLFAIYQVSLPMIAPQYAAHAKLDAELVKTLEHDRDVIANRMNANHGAFVNEQDKADFNRITKQIATVGDRWKEPVEPTTSSWWDTVTGWWPFGKGSNGPAPQSSPAPNTAKAASTRRKAIDSAYDKYIRKYDGQF